jgi:hypothetical protein
MNRKLKKGSEAGIGRLGGDIGALGGIVGKVQLNGVDGIDSEIDLILKKLSKKDTVTRVKALQELLACDNLPLFVWPAWFNKLAIDSHVPIRILVFQIHLKLSSQNSKAAFAPFIKQIIGHWLLATFDPTVRQLASESLNVLLFNQVPLRLKNPTAAYPLY